jgi:hypothetical protein
MFEHAQVVMLNFQDELWVSAHKLGELPSEYGVMLSKQWHYG